jgi:hypothetical protein
LTDIEKDIFTYTMAAKRLVVAGGSGFLGSHTSSPGAWADVRHAKLLLQVPGSANLQLHEAGRLFH